MYLKPGIYLQRTINKNQKVLKIKIVFLDKNKPPIYLVRHHLRNQYLHLPKKRRKMKIHFCFPKKKSNNIKTVLNLAICLHSIPKIRSIWRETHHYFKTIHLLQYLEYKMRRKHLQMTLLNSQPPNHHSFRQILDLNEKHMTYS